MNILAVDTATDACSAALFYQGAIFSKSYIAPRKHIELLKPTVAALLNEAGCSLKDIEGLALTIGPGSFAGLRIACGFIQGLGMGLELPVMPISTLEALAWPIWQDEAAETITSLVVMDAKMGEVYWGLYEREKHPPYDLIPLIPPCVSSPEGLVKDLTTYIEERAFSRKEPTKALVGKLIGVGDGFLAYPSLKSALKDTLTSRALPIPVAIHETLTYPQAESVAKIASLRFRLKEGLSASDIAPTYLRHNIALTLEEQRALKKTTKETTKNTN